MAHGSNVSCLSLGPSSGRVMVTGGEDRKVNMWAVGKPNVILVRTPALLLLWHSPISSSMHVILAEKCLVFNLVVALAHPKFYV